MQSEVGHPRPPARSPSCLCMSGRVRPAHRPVRCGAGQPGARLPGEPASLYVAWRGPEQADKHKSSGKAQDYAARMQGAARNGPPGWGRGAEGRLAGIPSRPPFLPPGNRVVDLSNLKQREGDQTPGRYRGAGKSFDFPLVPAVTKSYRSQKCGNHKCKIPSPTREPLLLESKTRLSNALARTRRPAPRWVTSSAPRG